jgi:hypothetical protein
MQIFFRGSKGCKRLEGGLNMTPGQVKGCKVSPPFVEIMERHPEAFEIRTPYDDMDPKELAMIEKVFGDDTKKLFQNIEGNAPPKPPVNPYADMTKKELYAVVEDNDIGDIIPDYKKLNLTPLCEAVTEAMAEE